MTHLTRCAVAARGTLLTSATMIGALLATVVLLAG
jgi:hypothetical protein